MMNLDVDATLAKMEKLRERMTRLEENPNPDQWQHTRLLIRALSEDISRAKKCPTPVIRKIRMDAPEAVWGDWQELVETLSKKGIQAETKKGASKD